MNRLADRIATIEASGIRRIFDLAANLAHPVNLSIGQPDFDVPDELKDKAVEAIRRGHNAYTQTQGGPELRSALLGGPLQGYSDKEVLVTGAVSGGLLLSYMVLLNPGDEILVPDPYFVMYKQLAVMCDAKPVFYDTYPDWRLDVGRIESLITPRTKAAVVGSPANPTGMVYTRPELEALSAVLRKNGVLAISDEIYESYCYDAPFASLRDVCRENTLALGGFSKSHAMTGWRVGWAAGPADLIEAMTKLQQFSFVCAPSPFQIAAAAALSCDMGRHMAAYKRKRDLLYAGLVDAGYEVEKPAGAFYAFPKVPWGTAAEFAEVCVRNNLLVIPGDCFSERDTHFRVVFAARDETIAAGVDILGRLRTRP